MWKLVPRRLRRWLLLAVAVPVGAWLLDRAAEAMAQRNGETTATRILREPRKWVGRNQAA